jgi:acyl-coenzyme A thioesterase PaaI-like protein
MHKAVAAHLLETRQVGKPYTAQLDIRYHRPVQVPGFLIIRAKVVARIGRKFWLRAVASQQLDHGEESLTTAAVALFLQLGDSTSGRL